jgi:hypothetical protein
MDKFERRVRMIPVSSIERSYGILARYPGLGLRRIEQAGSQFTIRAATAPVTTVPVQLNC